MQNYKFWNFWFWGHMTLKVTWPWKRKFAIISFAVRNRAKQSEFWILSELLHAKLQILKFSFCCVLIGLYKFAIISETLRDFGPLGISTFFKYILLRYFLETLLMVLSDSLYSLKWLTERSLKVNLFKIAVISETTRYIPLTWKL